MVCSHERSGTHFTMNSLSIVSNYHSNPWLNYDLHPLGADINFFSETSVKSFIKGLSNIKVNDKLACNASIIKSHFPLSHLGADACNLPLKIIYIWRDPAETIASLWKFMHRWNWNEGPKTETPLELAAARPSGQSQRYQTTNYKDYFERWAAHVIDGITQCKNNPNAYSVSYSQLLTEHTSTTIDICNSLSIKTLKPPSLPSKNQNIIKGKSLTISDENMTQLREFCHKRIEEFPELKHILKKAKNPNTDF